MGCETGIAQIQKGEDELGRFARVDVDSSLYSETAILKTAFWFTDTHYVFLSRQPGGTNVAVELRSKGDRTSEDLASACGEFTNKLLDSELRQRVIAETAEIRDTLVRKAFFEAKASAPRSLLSDESRVPSPDQSELGDPVGAGHRS